MWTFLVVLAGLVTACAPPEKSVEPEAVLVYPQPPEEPRFYYERTISGSGDVIKVTEELSLRSALTGTTGIESTEMEKPFGVAVHKGRVFVSDTVMRAVHYFDYAAQKSGQIGISGAGVLQKPVGMDVDAVGNLYVVDATASRVVVYTRDGDYLSAFGGKELLQRPSSVAVEEDGSRAYVVDLGGVSSDRHQILVFDVASGQHLHSIGKRGTGPAEFNLPREIELGPDGRLYVTDSANFRVQVLEKDGTFVRSFGEVGRQFGDFARPKGIAVDAEGNIYVADASFANFQIFSNNGELLLFIGQRGRETGPGWFLLPNGIEVDEDGRVYVVDQLLKKVDVFRPAGLSADAGYLVTGP